MTKIASRGSCLKFVLADLQSLQCAEVGQVAKKTLVYFSEKIICEISVREKQMTKTLGGGGHTMKIQLQKRVLYHLKSGR